ncbi:MAG: nuclear transport factor 2 family protein [Acidobacteria bacterium]|nr:nuclear transport factor 2 family protein [Acidobacteriota bacterium]
MDRAAAVSSSGRARAAKHAVRMLGILIALALGSAPAAAQEVPDTHAASDAAAEVLALERQIEAAVLRADVAFLDGVCAPDFTYTHGDGWITGGPVLGVDERDPWLASLAGRYSQREVDSQQIELHGDVAITMGRVRARSGAGDSPPRTFSFWYVRVYAHRDGGWQYLSHRTVHGPVYED